MEILVFAVSLIIILTIWLVIINKWRKGVYLLICYIPFAGIVTLALHPSPFPTIFKDILFIIPLYAAFFLCGLRKKHVITDSHVPRHIVLFIYALFVLVLIQSLNSSIPNWLVAFIGIKVWLFYLPMLFIGFAFIRNIDELVLLSRMMVIIAFIPCLIGIGEFVASSILGYKLVMTTIYGDAAKAATQNFQIYDVNAVLYRIPSTFSYWLQYSGYTMSMIIPAYILWQIDRNRMWRTLAKILFGITVVASLLSGAKANFIFIPLLVVTIFAFEGNIKRGLIFAMGILVLFAGVLLIGDFNLVTFSELMIRLFVRYYNELFIGGISEALQNAPWEWGPE